MIEVRIPTTGNAGEDAVLLDWLVDVGGEVREGDPLATLETAKAVHEVTATATGVLLERCLASGDAAAEHAVLAVIGEPGETPPPREGPSSTPGGSTAPARSPSADAAMPAPAALPTSTAPAPGPTGSDRASGPEARAVASPRARIMAERRGLDLTGITGTGPGGRIIVRDVLAAPSAAEPSPAREPSSSAADPDRGVEVVPVRGARKVTAQRMHASLQESAQVTLTRYADARALLAYLRRLRDAAEDLGLPRLTVTDLVLFATAHALTEHPELNATFDWDEIHRHRAVHLGVAVDTERALLVPVIRDADTLSLVDLARRTASAAERARSGATTAEDMEGGTFTVSSLGSLGVHWFTPVLNPPQVGILGIGRALPSSPSGADLMPLSLTFDHRAIDGAAAAAAFAGIARAIESVDLLAAV